MKRSFSLLLALPAVTLMTHACGRSHNGGILPLGGAGDTGTGTGGKNDNSSTGGSGNNGEAGSDAGGTGSTGNTATCGSDKDCSGADQVCDVARSICVDCLTSTDCGENAECTDNECVSHTACASSKDCGGDQVCDKTQGYCVECIGANDCSTGELCVAGSCVASCASDKDCSANDQVCDTGGGYCVDCLTNDDCPSAEYCSASHSCVADVCTAGKATCSDNTLMTCNADGTGFDQLACPDICVSDDGPAHCGEDLPVDCASGTANLCSSIPKLTGTQTVDGEPDEFCNVPSQLISVANAGFISGPTGAPTTADGKTSSAQAKIAWSPGYVHVYVRVVDPLIVEGTGLDYNYDNVQLFIAPTVPSMSGQIIMGTCPSSVGQAQQIFMVPSDGVHASHVTFSCTGSTPASGTYEYAAKATTNGYAVELKYPMSTTSGQIGLDLMIGVNDSGVRDYEYGLYMGSPATTSCTPNKSPWCDPMLWCTPTLAQ